MGCTMVQFVWQEFDKLAKFANSLLNRSSKLTDMAQSLENEMHHVKGKDPESPDVARSEKLGTQRELISNSSPYMVILVSIELLLYMHP